MSCLIVIASVCIPWSESRAEITDNSLQRTVTVTGSRGAVTIEAGGDHIVSGGWSSAARFCDGPACVEYRRADGDTETTFLIRRPDCDVARRIVVSAATPGDRTALIEELAIIPAHHGADRALRLSRLTEVRPLPSRAERMTPGDRSCGDAL